MNELYNYIYEKPLVYDDESETKLGKKDKKTGTIWGNLPPVDISYADLLLWVSEMRSKGILMSGFHGRGASREVTVNDGKTVFKFNHDVSLVGNQTAIENETYIQLKDKWGDCFPKIFAMGDNWSVQEKATVILDMSPFKKLLSKEAFQTTDRKEIDTKLQRFCHDVLKGKIDMYEYGSKQSYIEAKKYVDEKSKSDRYDLALHELLHIKPFQRIFYCAFANGLLGDFRLGNIGMIGNRFVILDYGVRSTAQSRI